MPRPAFFAKALRKSLRVFRLGKANTTKSPSSRRREYVSGTADSANVTSLSEAPHLFGRKRHVVRPVSLK